MNTETANNVSNIVTKLELQHSQKRDRIVPGKDIFYQSGALFLTKNPLVTGQIPTDICHSQIAEKLGIPAAYYKRMQINHQGILEANINGWLGNDHKAKYLLRCLETEGPENSGLARAFLSNNYNIIDNYDVLLAGLEAIKKMGIEVEVTRAEVTDSRMYLHVVCPKIEQDATEFLRGYMRENDAVGNGIISGFVLSNSEVGKGAFEIRPRAVIVKCNNGLMTKDDRFRKIHLGATLEEGDIKWSQQTKNRNYQLIISQTQDAIKTFLSKDYLGVMIQKIADANKIVLEHPLGTVENVCRELSITEDHKKSILDYFLTDGDKRASGVFQAITRQAQSMNADMQYDVEAGAADLLPVIKKFDKPFSKS